MVATRRGTREKAGAAEKSEGMIASPQEQAQRGDQGEEPKRVHFLVRLPAGADGESARAACSEAMAQRTPMFFNEVVCDPDVARLEVLGLEGAAAGTIGVAGQRAVVEVATSGRSSSPLLLDSAMEVEGRGDAAAEAPRLLVTNAHSGRAETFEPAALEPREGGGWRFSVPPALTAGGGRLEVFEFAPGTEKKEAMLAHSAEPRGPLLFAPRRVARELERTLALCRAEAIDLDLSLAFKPLLRGDRSPEAIRVALGFACALGMFHTELRLLWMLQRARAHGAFAHARAHVETLPILGLFIWCLLKVASVVNKAYGLDKFSPSLLFLPFYGSWLAVSLHPRFSRRSPSRTFQTFLWFLLQCLVSAYRIKVLGGEADVQQHVDPARMRQVAVVVNICWASIKYPIGYAVVLQALTYLIYPGQSVYSVVLGLMVNHALVAVSGAGPIDLARLFPHNQQRALFPFWIRRQ